MGAIQLTTSIGQHSMPRNAICLFLMITLGCSREPVSSPVARGRVAETEDGGTVENADRTKADDYFSALGEVQTAEEEAKLLSEFGEWLRKKRYAIRANVKNGKHNLSCPYFPPVTPWTSHSFFDLKNLELLPRLESGAQQAVANGAAGQATIGQGRLSPRPSERSH